MKTYHFQLILGTPTTDEQEERLFERFEGRVSPAVANGVPLLYVHLDAPLMEHAIRDAVQRARSLGLSVERVELDPDVISADAA